MSRHGRFESYAERAEKRKENAMKRGHNAPIPHELWRVIVPIAREYEAGNVDIAVLYSYLLAHVNGQPDNDRYMSAFTSVDRIAKETRIGRNRIARLIDVLVAVGLLETTYDYTGNKREKLYYPTYYSDLSEAEMRRNLDELYSRRE